MIAQSPNKILLVNPDYFTQNKKTASTNSFQYRLEDNTIDLSIYAKKEFQTLLNKLNKYEIEHYVFKSVPGTPDAVFPNNWFSTHANGKLVLYPMYADNRRLERNPEIIDFLKNQLGYNDVLDLSVHENGGFFLEGTGSMVLHHPSKTMFTCLSARTDENMVKLFCEKMNFNPIIFKAYDKDTEIEIYHTNVLMSIATYYAVICSECIPVSKEKKMVLSKLEELNLNIVNISEKQMNAFCGNIIEVINNKGNLITLMSESAYNNFTKKQLKIISQSSEILQINIENIEKYGGGSVRCMITGLH